MADRLGARESKSDHARNLSHGRGGAGNMAKVERRGSGTAAADLVTPTLKSEHYTTGRGGSGNMAKNDKDKPEVARIAQDVEAPMHREPEGNFHFGRGGAANFAKPSEEEKKMAKSNNEKRKSTELQHIKTGEDTRGLAEKGKDLLVKITGKK